MKWLLILILFSSGCTVTKTEYSSLDKNDDGSVTVYSPHYVVNRNKVTTNMFAVGAGIGGGYFGYKSNYDLRVFEEQKGPNNYINAAIGGLGSFVIAKYMTRLITHGKQKPIHKSESGINKWIRKNNSNYVFMPGYNTRISIGMIHKRYQTEYIAKSYLDLINYTSAFPKSKKIDNIVIGSLDNIKRKDYPNILNLVQGISNSTTMDIRKKYILECKTLKDFNEATIRFPAIVSNPAKMALKFIHDLSDVKYYQTNYNNQYQKELHDLAIGFVETTEEVLKYDIIYPGSPKLDDLISKIIPTLDEKSCEILLSKFPKSSQNKLVTYKYLSLSNSIEDLLDKKESSILLKTNPDTDFYNEVQVKQLLYRLAQAKDLLGFENTKRMVRSTQTTYLGNKYNSIPKDNNSLKVFLQYISNNSWVGKEAGQNYRDKAMATIAANDKVESDRLYELDNVYNYVYVKDGFINELEGSDLSIWQSIWSSTVDMANHNVFVFGYLVNDGDLPKTVKLTTTVNLLEESISMWGHSKDIDGRQGYFYTEIPPHSEQYFVTMIDYTWKFKDERHFLWGRNYLAYMVDKEKPVEIDLQYYDKNISSSKLSDQAELVNQYKALGNVGKSSGYQSSYKISTDGSEYQILDKTSTTDVTITKNVDRVDANGCISIISDGYESDGYYHSEIFGKYGSLYSSTDYYDDNAAGCFNASDFPLEVKVSYTSDADLQISAIIRLLDYKDYTIKVID